MLASFYSHYANARAPIHAVHHRRDRLHHRGLWLTSALLTPTPIGPAAAPSPAAHPGAIVRVYGANVWGLRGRFAIHTWIATKASGASEYTLYQVIGWQLRRRGTAVSIRQDRPDRPWFGSPAILLHEVRGAQAEALVTAVHNAVLRYPYADAYTMWPGPNSNSFTQWVAAEVPALGLALPMKAIGKNWMQQNIDDARALAGREHPPIEVNL